MARSISQGLHCSVWMALLPTLLLAAVVENVPVEVSLGDETCVTTVTTSTTMAASLMQAATVRTRLKEGVGGPEELVQSDNHAPTLDAGKQHDAQLNASEKADKIDHGREETSSPCLLHTSLAAATSLLQHGQDFALSALDRLTGGPPTIISLLPKKTSLTDTSSWSSRQRVSASTGALILIVGLLFVLGASAFLAMMSLTSNSEPQMPNEMPLRAQSPYGSRLFLPMTASGSPSPSLRSTRTSFAASQQRIHIGPGPPPPEGVKFSPIARIPLAKSVNDGFAEEDKSTKRKSVSELHFCPDLVVPQHCECILVLPLDIGSTYSSFTIMDVHGSPVLKALPEQPKDGYPWRAMVTTSTGESLVTCCEVRPYAGAGAEFHLMRAKGQLFAKLVHNPSQDKYFLTLQRGTVLSIWGNFANSAVNITDDGNRLLATTEVGPADFDPTGTYCRLRVAPLADVGLALCGLLCIAEHLRHNK